ncbi:gap junction protein alpha 4 [Kryptolebias marmoratus]|uniref:gap junction protein alpha 4 n=1 Tax=Kryptolebias marmoratus TaxID=37003 RepID=UPI0007F8FD2F|nr:gap junction protein alpha 4 [Kryptolebias marmoratus]
MSRADWSFLEDLLEKGQEYSTPIGRVWLTVLFLFRLLVLGTAAESAWDDEQADFVCNTRQPGCTPVCYNTAFPISHFRYFVLQVIFVSTPTIFYFGYVAVHAGKSRRNIEVKDEKQTGKILISVYRGTKEDSEEKEKERSGGSEPDCAKSSDEPVKLRGTLLGVYMFSILLKVLLETGFIVGLWFLYDGFFIAAKFECTGFPCPHTVDCFVSRPTEKTIFTIYTQVIAAVSLLLNLTELLHLLARAASRRLEERRQDSLPRSERARRDDPKLEARRADATLNTNGATEPNPGRGATAGADPLPSYVNCMDEIRRTHSNTFQYTEHLQAAGKNPNSPSKGQQKHYV